MRIEEAHQVLDRIDLRSRRPPRETPEQREARAAELLRLLDDAPDGWVLDWCDLQFRRGLLPSVARITKGWSDERRSILRGVELPEGVETRADIAVWRATFCAAYLRTRSRETAVKEAREAVGLADVEPLFRRDELPDAPRRPWRDIVREVELETAARLAAECEAAELAAIQDECQALADGYTYDPEEEAAAA